MNIFNEKYISNELLNMKLIDMRCKHVLNTSSNKKDLQVLNLSTECGYKWCLWGSHSGHSGNTDYHIKKIVDMENCGFTRPVRIVVCSYPFSPNTKVTWVDNLHTAIYYLRLFGKDLILKEMPFYIVDISEYDDKLYDYQGSLSQSKFDLAGALECAYHRRIRSNNKELIELNYTVSDLLKANPRLWTAFNNHMESSDESDEV